MNLADVVCSGWRAAPTLLSTRKQVLASGRDVVCSLFSLNMSLCLTISAFSGNIAMESCSSVTMVAYHFYLFFLLDTRTSKCAHSIYGVASWLWITPRRCINIQSIRTGIRLQMKHTEICLFHIDLNRSARYFEWYDEMHSTWNLQYVCGIDTLVSKAT